MSKYVNYSDESLRKAWSNARQKDTVIRVKISRTTVSADVKELMANHDEQTAITREMLRRRTEKKETV